MLWLCLLLIWIFSVLKVYHKRLDFIGLLGLLLLGPLFCVFLGMVILGTFPINVVEKTTPIYSLNTSYVQDGPFLLGVGTVKSDTYYYFLKDTDNNSKILSNCRASSTEIRNSSSLKPSLLTFSNYISFPQWAYWLVYPFSKIDISIDHMNSVLIVPDNLLLENYVSNKQ